MPKIDINFEHEFKVIKDKVDKGLLAYTLEVRDFSRRNMPIDTETMRSKTDFRRISPSQYQVFSQTEYSEYQHDESLFHLGNPGTSISKAYSGAKRALLNALSKRINERQQALHESKSLTNRTKTKQKALEQINRRYRRILSVRAGEYDYGFGYRILKGWRPKFKELLLVADKYGQKGALIKYQAKWFDPNRIEKELPPLKDFIEERIIPI